MQMSPFLISQGSNYGYNLVDGFQSAFSQIIDFFFFFALYFSEQCWKNKIKVTRIELRRWSG